MKRPFRIGLAILSILVGWSALLYAQSPVDALKRSGEREENTPANNEPADAPANAERATTAQRTETAPAEPAEPAAARRPKQVYVIPIHDAISRPNQFIFRRGVKEAIANNIDAIVLDINTPGGAGNVMLDIMERAADFQGDTIAFVNREAISAGAFIAFAADQIWYHPRGVIGAAEPVAAGGQDLPEGIRRKFDSYVQARMRALADEHPHKALVLRAMMDPTFELVLDGEVLSPEGSILSLTATEAMRKFGDPPTPLFGEGIATDVEDLLNQLYGEGNWELRTFEVTWSEELAKFMDRIAPLLIGIGFIALFVEFKTPGFGVFGFLGVTMLVIVFLSNYVAGLAGYEVLIFFFLGILLIAIELFVFPGTFVALIAGLALVIGSILWSMADLWPAPGGGVIFDPQAFVQPMVRFSFSLIFTVSGIAILWKILPESVLLKRVALQTALAKANPVTAGGGRSGTDHLPDVGQVGSVITPLRPSGTVEINGDRFEAACSLGMIERGEEIMVTGYRNFHLLVDRKPSK